MSKWVRLENNIVREIIPDAATVPSIGYWYGEEFAAMCREAPDEVEQRWVYDPEVDVFSAPQPDPPPEPPPDYMAFIAGLMEGYSSNE